MRRISQSLRVAFPVIIDLMIQSPPSQKLAIQEPSQPVPYSPPSSLEYALPPPDLSLQLAVQNRVRPSNRLDSSQGAHFEVNCRLAIDDQSRRRTSMTRFYINLNTSSCMATVLTQARGQSSGSLMTIRMPRLHPISVSSWKETSCDSSRAIMKLASRPDMRRKSSS